MILASDIITLARVNDGAKGATGKGVKLNTRYYCLQASATKPSKPTTNPPDSKWTTTEPSYTMGNTSYLYTVDLTVYTDNSFLYSDVSLSSSYEAAKAAYAKAVNAETEISKTNEEVALKASKNEVTETLKGYATTASMNAAITTKANEITSSVAANYATNASVNLLSGDPSNYSQLNDSTASYWGFTADSTADGHWYTMNRIARDKQVSQWYECRGGEKLKIECEISTSCKGNTTSGGTDSVYALTRIGIFGQDDSGASKTYTFSSGVTASASTPATAVSTTITIPSSARKFAVFVQTESWGNFSGTIKVRKLMVSKVNAALDRISSAETRITQNETSINSKASQTEVNELSNTINATKTVVDQNSNKWSVAATKVENMRLAGDNILKKQDYGLGEPDSDEGWWGRWVDFSAGWLKNISRSKYGFHQGVTSGAYARFGCIRNVNLTRWKTYTLSFIGFCSSPSGTYTETQPIIITWMKNNSTEYISEYYVTVNCGAQMYSITMNSDSTYVENSTIRFCAYNANGNALQYETWITDIMLTEGEIPARWSPSPFDGAKTTTVTVDHSGMYVNTEGVIEFNTNKFEITPPDGGDQLFSVNASTKNLKAQNGYFTYLSAPNAATKPTSTSRDVWCGIGGPGQYPSIQDAWNSLPDICGDVYFEVDGNVSGYAILRGKYVSWLRIRGTGDTKYTIGRVTFEGLAGEITNVIMDCNEGEWDKSLALYGSKFYCHDTTIASSGYGVQIYNSSSLTLTNCEFSGVGSYSQPRHSCIYANGGFVGVYNCTGGGSMSGLYLDNGALAVLRGTVPGASVSRGTGYILGTAGTDYTLSGSVPEVPVVTKTATFTPSTWCTWECISGSLWKRVTVNVSVQSRSWSGLNNKNQYPNGFCKRAGWWVLDTGTSIKDTLSGKTISKATVIINRTNTGEAYKLTLAYHGVTNCNLNGYSVSADYNIANQLISIGVYDISADSGQVIIDLPSSLYSKLQDGTIKGFGLLNNGTYFKDVYCDGTCTLNVTYT